MTNTTTRGTMSTKTTKRFAVFAANGEGLPSRVTGPLSLAEARSICTLRRDQAYAHGKSRAATRKLYRVCDYAARAAE